MIRIIPSKSYAHRALILSALSNESCEVICDLESDDILATKASVKALMSGEKELYVRESGSTLRFLIPVAAALGRSVTFITEGRLYERPLGSLKEELEKHGAHISMLGEGRIGLEGKITPGTYRMPGNISSQYITGLLMALPMLDGDSEIVLTSPLESSGYVDMTIDTMKKFGVAVRSTVNNIQVTGNQKYGRNEAFIVEGDWSNAAFWLAAGAAGPKEIAVSGLSMGSKQGDKRILEILGSAGADIEITDDVITVKPSLLKGLSVDISDTPDLAPVVAVIGAAAEGVTRITNASRLRLKESDRIESIVSSLKALGIGAEDAEDSITITGAGIRHDGGAGGLLPFGGTVSSAGDHRIAMMASVLSLITAGPVMLKGSSAVSKSYPDFFEVMKEEGLTDNLMLV